MNVNFSATGFWKIENSDSQYHGDLYLNEDEGGIILYIRVPYHGSSKSYLELPLDIRFVNGTTFNGAKVTLIDCLRISTEISIGNENVYGYQANYMLKGVTFEKEENIAFSQMSINIPGIIQWGDVSNYVIPKFAEENVLIGLNRIDPIEIYSSEEYSLSYSLAYNYPYNLMKEEIKLEQTPFLIIKSKSLQSLNWFIDIAIKIKRIIEIAMGVPLGFHKMIAESPEITLEFEDGKKQVIPIEITHALTRNDNNSSNGHKVTRRNFLFTLKELSNNANFSQWQEVSSIMEPIIELYIDDLYNQELSASRHFLNMIQALETYHSRIICNGTLADYKKRVGKLISNRHDSFKQSDREFLLGESPHKFTLRNRIADLILADFRFRFYTGNINYLEFPKVISDTRNYYTHYNQKKEEKALKDENLVNAYYILRNILEYYLLKELGFEEKFIHERIRTRIQPIRTSIEINSIAEREKNK